MSTRQRIRFISFICLFFIAVSPLLAQETGKAVEPEKFVVSDEEATQEEGIKKAEEAGTDEQAEPGISPFNFYMGIGSEIIDDVTYSSIALQPELVFGKFGLGLDVIIRFDAHFKIYKPDWDSANDIIAKVNYIRWDKKGAPFFAKIGLLNDVYLGHGSIFYRYSNKLFLPAVRRIGVQFDLDLKSFGWELFDDDVIDNRIFGGRLFFRPFYKSPIFFLNKLALGFTAAADVKLSKDSPAEKVTVIGGDIDIPVFNVKDLFEFILFTDYAKNLYFEGKNGSGVTPGFILNLLGFRFIGEYHIYQPKFDGPYFNAFYDIERNSKIALLEQKNEKTEGWSVKMAKDFFGWVFIGFEIGANKDENPDMHLELGLLQKLLNKFQASVYYDKTDIDSFDDAVTAQAPNARLTLNATYSVSKNVNLIVAYRRSFIERETEYGKTVEPVENISFQTRIGF